MKLTWNKRKAQNIVDELNKESLLEIDDEEVKKLIRLHLDTLKKLKWEEFHNGVNDFNDFMKNIHKTKPKVDKQQTADNWNKDEAQKTVDNLRMIALAKIDDSPFVGELKKIIAIYLDGVERLEHKEFYDTVNKFKYFIESLAPLENWFSKKTTYGASFDNVIQWCKHFANQKNTKAEKRDVYKFYMNAIREDMKYSLLTRVIYGLPSIKLNLDRLILPSYYYVNGKKTEFNAEAETQQFDVSKTCFISAPDCPERLFSLLKVNGDVGVFTNYLAYCTEIGIGFTCGNGNHTIAAKNLVGGYVESTVYNTAKLFEHVTTDGLVWKDSKSGEKLDDVLDFRIAVLYELSKELYKL